MSTALPQRVELCLRNAVCCMCCGLEVTVATRGNSDRYDAGRHLYETTGFLTCEDIFRIIIPLSFSILSFAGVLFHIIYPLFYGDIMYLQAALAAFVSFVTSTYSCRYIYTFDTSLSEKLDFKVMSLFICIEKYFALFLSIGSCIAFIVDFVAYMTYYANPNFPYPKPTKYGGGINSSSTYYPSPTFYPSPTPNPAVLAMEEEMYTNNQMNEKTVFLIKLVWEGSMLLWSTVWFCYVLKALNLQKEMERSSSTRRSGIPVFSGGNTNPSTRSTSTGGTSANSSRGSNNQGGGGGNNNNSNNQNIIYARGSVYTEENVCKKNADVDPSKCEKQASAAVTTQMNNNSNNTESTTEEQPTVTGETTAVFHSTVAATTNNNNEGILGVRTQDEQPFVYRANPYGGNRGIAGGIHPVTIGRPVTSRDLNTINTNANINTGAAVNGASRTHDENDNSTNNENNNNNVVIIDLSDSATLNSDALNSK